jgi:plastocyanin
MRLVLRLAIPAVIAGLTFIACASTSTPATGAAAQGGTVSIKGFAFAPATLTVAKGTTVTFKNEDTTRHTVTSGANGTKDGKFDQSVDANAQASVTFDTPGTYQYYCALHAAMKGTVVVE